jgi:N-methylhydantoinase A
VIVSEAGLRIHKVPSTPENPAKAVLAGLDAVVGRDHYAVIHGSTVATNAILERNGARTALLTTLGFEDVIEIGRQIRPSIYDLNVTKPPPLVPPSDRIGIRERIGASGEVVTPLQEGALSDTVGRLMEKGVESVAICFLHSYANPDHERRVADAVREKFTGFVSVSHEVLPEFREYERCSTTVINAYVGPIMKRYLANLASDIGEENLRVMQSNGGVISADAAGALAVQTVLSGPAGGAVGGFEAGKTAGYEHVITFDMGGTSTDVCLCPGEIGRTVESTIGDLPIRVPVIDIHTVGAGGGSIAYRDPGGSLKVGPRSAGAVPGPICYGRGGTEITVTDANLVLGRLSPDHFLGGQTRLDPEPVRSAMRTLAAAFDLSEIELAHGIVRVANATMERAIRVISLERGFDPRDFTLVCFGGAGGMHAADLARGLGIPRVLVPKGAGTLSALGMLLADFVRDYSRTILTPSDELTDDRVESIFRELEARAMTEYQAENVLDSTVTMARSFDMRYVGQGYELSIPSSANYCQAFHQAHERRYGYADARRATEVVNVRLQTVGRTPRPDIPTQETGDAYPGAAVAGDIEMVFDGVSHKTSIYSHDLLRAGNVIAGPALIAEYSTTTTIPPDFRCRVDIHHNLILEAQ